MRQVQAYQNIQGLVQANDHNTIKVRHVTNKLSYTRVWFLVHRDSRMTPYACRRSFGPLTFSPKFMITWLILFEYAILVLIKTRRICSFGLVRIVLMDQNCKFGTFMITWLQITSNSQVWSIKTIRTRPKLHIRRVLIRTKSAYSKRIYHVIINFGEMDPNFDRMHMASRDYLLYGP